MKQFSRYLVTSALPYANGPLHVGHIAGAYLPADIYVRYLRMRGRDVVFVCGSDEHGAAITLQAKKEGIQPADIINKYHQQNEKAFEDFGISFDVYHRTSSELHHETAQSIFKEMHAQGCFEQQTSEQFYDEEYNQFLADRYVSGECPNCAHPKAYGDQCENCGTSLNPADLINPVSTLSGKKPELRETTHWFLPLDQYETWLKEWIVEGKGRTEKWKKNVSGQCKSWLDDGLHPRAVTRDLDWGVKVPIEGADGKVLYVWFDAPIGYISATKKWASDRGCDWQPYWQSDDTKLVHFVGKDNIVFHCIVFPAILKAMGSYILPTNVPANEFMNYEGDKMSTSRQWAVGLADFVRDFPNQIDALRYNLCANMPETKDSEFTWADFQARNNNELVATLGNYVNRIIVLTNKYFDGSVPPKTSGESPLRSSLLQSAEKMAASFEAYRFREALEELIDIARAGNRYLTEKEPWKLIKTDANATGAILNDCLQHIYGLACLMQPFMPSSAAKIGRMLNTEIADLKWDALEIDQPLAEAHQIGKAELLFSKIDTEHIAPQLENLAQLRKARKEQESIEASQAASLVLPAGPKPEVTFDDFMKMDIRVGTILEAEKVKKADKLLQMQVDLGFETRTIVSGIAEYFRPDELPGKQVSVLVNLAPRKIRGIVSQGMILLAEGADGNLFFVEPTGRPQSSSGQMTNGAEIR